MDYAQRIRDIREDNDLKQPPIGGADKVSRQCKPRITTLAPRKQQRDRRYQTSAPTKAHARALTANPRTK